MNFARSLALALRPATARRAGGERAEQLTD